MHQLGDMAFESLFLCRCGVEDKCMLKIQAFTRSGGPHMDGRNGPSS